MNKLLRLKLSNFLNPVVVFLLLFPLIGSCTKRFPDSIPSICLLEKKPCLQGKAFVAIKTNRGIITVELDGENSPVTAGNFLDLVNKGIYEDTIFHRVIRIPFPFVIQGGDPLSKNPKTQEVDYGKGSFIDPNNGQVRFIPLEIKLKGEESPRYNQLVTNPKELTELQLVHQKGSLAMARSQQPDSGSSQFYIALKSLPELDGRYSVFGKVIQGINILDSIIEGDIILETKVLIR